MRSDPLAPVPVAVVHWGGLIERPGETMHRSDTTTEHATRITAWITLAMCGAYAWICAMIDVWGSCCMQ